MSNTSSPTDIQADAGRVLCELALVLGRVDPRDLPVAAAASMMTTFIEIEKRAAAGRLLLAARASEAEQWKSEGYRSPEEWLAAKQGCTTGRARNDLSTSGRLSGLDDTSGALRDGKLSPDQADAVSDAAAVNPASEGALLDAAEGESLKSLRDEAARRKAEVEDAEKRRRRIHRDRRCRSWVDRDGAWNISARGPAEAGAGFAVELEKQVNAIFEEARRNGDRESRDAYAFDALMRLGGRSVAPSEPAARENLRHLALIRVDLEALRNAEIRGGQVCEIDGVGPISLSAARELLGESILKLVITRGVEVANVTHLGRSPTVAQLIALLWSQPTCVVKGCNRASRLDIDHRGKWSELHITELANLDRLCEHHHGLKTQKNWALVSGTGRRRMVPPGHRDHPDQSGDPPCAGPDSAGSARRRRASKPANVELFDTS